MRLQQVGLFESVGKLLKKFFPDPPVPTVSACLTPTYLESGNSEIGNPREVTSRSEASLRQKAGADILINATIMNTIGMNSVEVKVRYSDGGSETFKYVSGNPRGSYIKTPSDLEAGDGVSKCPP